MALVLGLGLGLGRARELAWLELHHAQVDLVRGLGPGVRVRDEGLRSGVRVRS